MLGLRQIAEDDEIGEDAAEELLEWIEDIRWHSLTSWEEGFLSDLYQRLDEYGGRTRLSERQLRTIDSLRSRLD